MAPGSVYAGSTPFGSRLTGNPDTRYLQPRDQGADGMGCRVSSASAVLRRVLGGTMQLEDVSVLGGLRGIWSSQLSPTRQIAAWVLAVAGPALPTLVSLPLHSPLVLGGFLFCMLLVVIATGVIGGTLPALAGVVLGVRARQLFFGPPFRGPR